VRTFADSVERELSVLLAILTTEDAEDAEVNAEGSLFPTGS
jgi:hypothetical protein